VHEAYDDDRLDAQIIEQPLLHITFENRAELISKLWRYTRLDAAVLVRHRRPLPLLVFKLLTSPIAAFILWYGRRRGFLDGLAGLQLSMYAAAYKWLTYARALKYRARLRRSIYRTNADRMSRTAESHTCDLSSHSSETQMNPQD
jgi:hypothetical protein